MGLSSFTMADEFAQADSGASDTYPMQCSALRKGGYVVIKDHPCKIVDMSTSKTGKHGHAKVNMVALDIFTGKKYEDICPSTHSMNVPNVKRTEYELVDIDDEGFMSLMDDDGNTRDDIKLRDGVDIDEEIRKKFEAEETFKVIIQAAMGMEAPIDVKNLAN